MSSMPTGRAILRLRFSADRRRSLPESPPARDDPQWSELLDRIDRLETRQSRRT
ncbi:MAG TPA: hypothetical protein VK472_01960 [Allosphingosinicella sp.]|nr:hypothetical protein [Allosphingosinicella sp.]